MEINLIKHFHFSGKRIFARKEEPLTPNNLSRYFQNVGVDTRETAARRFKSRMFEEFPKVTKVQVERIIQKLKKSDTSDAYGLSNNALRKVKSHISQVVADIINESFEANVYPDKLKLALIMPNLKDVTSNEYDATNYRPISIMPRIAMIFEIIMKEALEDHLLRNNLYLHQQHAYIKGRTGETALLLLFDNINKRLQEGKHVVFAKCDLSKAFDTIDVNILLYRLKECGICGKVLAFINSYLQNRETIVKRGKLDSDIRKVRTGLLQGSVLSTVFFNIFLRDLPRNIPCEVVMYSDDIAFVVSSKSTSKAEKIRKRMLATIEMWCANNGMAINKKKSQSLPKMDCFRYLGVEINCEYTWNSHVEYLRKALNIGIRKIQKADKNQRESAYFKSFYIKLMYAILLWGNTPEAAEIFEIQKEAVRLIGRNTMIERDIFIQKKIMTLPSLYIQQCLRFLHKLNCNEYRHNQYLRNCVPATAKELYNSLPAHVRSYEFNDFKGKIKNVCLSQAFYNLQEFTEFDWSMKSLPGNEFTRTSYVNRFKRELDNAVEKILSRSIDETTYFVKFQSLLVKDYTLPLCNEEDLNEIFELQKDVMALLLGIDRIDRAVFSNRNILTVPSLYIRKCIRAGFTNAGHQYGNVVELYNHLPGNIRQGNYRKFITKLNRILLDGAFNNVNEFYEVVRNEDFNEVM